MVLNQTGLLLRLLSHRDPFLAPCCSQCTLTTYLLALSLAYDLEIKDKLCARFHRFLSWHLHLRCPASIQPFPASRKYGSHLLQGEFAWCSHTCCIIVTRYFRRPSHDDIANIFTNDCRTILLRTSLDSRAKAVQQSHVVIQECDKSIKYLIQQLNNLQTSRELDLTDMSKAEACLLTTGA